MLLVQTLREQIERSIAGLKKKNFHNPVETIESILESDDKRKQILTQLENFRAELNKVSKTIGNYKSQGKHEEAEQAKIQTGVLKENIQTLENEITIQEKILFDKLVLLPNLPNENVPFGKTPEENTVVFRNNIDVNLPESALPHWDLAAKHNLIDFELGVKLTGAGFPVYRGKGAKLQRALINFFLDAASKAGYEEVQPPILINEDSGFGTGQLPDKEGQMYFVSEDKLYLIPTAEVPITNIFRDVIIDTNTLPIKCCGYTPCFRREAGSYGKDVRGLNRLHQFDKVEIVQIAEPEHSYVVLEEMKNHVQGLLEELELPYRVLLLCGGDMSFSSAQTYDLEVYSAGQKRWLEVSSVSNFENFQSNRLKLRGRASINEKPHLMHTLNGSALALPRIVAAILENNQKPDGSIQIPKALQKYTGFESI